MGVASTAAPPAPVLPRPADAEPAAAPPQEPSTDPSTDPSSGPAAEPDAPADPASPAESPDSQDAVLEAYLQSLGLTDLLAAHLRERYDAAPAPRRAGVAGRLAAVYAAELANERDPARRAEIERRSVELLAVAPDSPDFDELRISLAKARYLRAEVDAERARLRIATDADARAALATLQSVAQELGETGKRLDRRVTTLEQALKRGSERGAEEARQQLEEARRLRSLAMYYAGWSRAYVAALTGSSDEAERAILHLGNLLNAEGRRPTLDQLPRTYLRYEHIARAALGVAWALSIAGDQLSALAWLDEIERGEGVSPAVLSLVFVRRADALARAGRFEALQLAVERRRRVGLDPAAPAEPLDPSAARSVSVAVLEAVQTLPESDARRRAAEAVAALALGDLVRRGEIASLLDLVRRYGTLPLGSAGFVPRYVRGVFAYDEARAAHTLASPDASDEPAADPALAERFRSCADLLAGALAAEDAPGFPAERGNCRLLLGLCRYYAGDLAAAADEFQAASADAPPDVAERSLWLAVVALDKLAQRDTSPAAAEKLRRVGLLFIASYPRSAMAPRLLLSIAGAAAPDDERAAEVLLAVTQEDPLYEPAQRRLADMLFRLWSSAAGEARVAESARFLRVAERVLAMDLEAARAAAQPPPDAPRTAKSAALTTRRILAVLLSTPSPDIRRARQALDAADEALRRLSLTRASVGLDTEQDLAFREAQVLEAESRFDEADALARRLADMGSPASPRLRVELFRSALAAWRPEPGDTARAARVVSRGLACMEGRSLADALATDGVLRTVAAGVAEAAAVLFAQQADPAARDLALRLDEAALDAGVASAEQVQRLGTFAAQLERWPLAYRAHTALTAGQVEGTPAWFEAKANALDALSRFDPATTIDAIAQHRVLYPDLGPEPHGDRILQAEQRASAPRAPAPPEDGISTEPDATPPEGTP